MNDKIEKRRALIDERIRKNALIPEEERMRRMQSFVERLKQIGEEYSPYASERPDDEHQGGARV